MTTSITSAALLPGPVKRLPNGLGYLVLEDHAMPVVSLQIWVRCGAVNEDDRTNGVSHFLEHMIFKGTPRLDANQIAKVVESRGGAINAATGTELTHYYVDMPSDAFADAFDVLADSVLNPAFPPAEFEKERMVILEEIKRRNDDPESQLWDTFLETVFRQSAYRRTVIGTVDTITQMTRPMMVDQHKRYYVPSNMVVIIAGDVKKAAAVKKIKEYFAGKPKIAPPALPNLLEPAPESSRVVRRERPLKQAHVAVGFTGPALTDPRQVAMDVLAVVLGGGNSSRLYQDLRENKQKVWNVGASFITNAGSGAFGIFAQCPAEKARGLSSDIYLILSDAESNGFSKEELSRAKAQIRSSWLFSQETYHGQASQWGFYAALGHPELAATYLSKLAKVKTEDLKNLLSAYFQNRELSGVVLVPKEPS